MPPKKKTKAGASSSANYDTHKFWNEKAQTLYETTLTRPILPERGINLSDQRGVIFPELERREWVELAQTPLDAVIPVVREFYANLRIQHEDDKVLVRGKMVSFDPQTINMIYNMPSYDRDEYADFLESGVDYGIVIRDMCAPGATWKMNPQGPVSLKKSEMSPSPKAWTSFVLARIIPSSHYYDVTKDKVALVYAIMTKKSIDLGKIIYGSIIKAGTGSNSVALPCPHIITELCQHAGVKWGPDEQVMKAKAPITAYFGDASYDLRPPQMQEQHHAPPPPPPVQRTNQGQRLDRLEAEMRDQRQALFEQRQVLDAFQFRSNHFMDYMMDFTAVLSQRFPPIGPDDPAFPPQPVWPPPYPAQEGPSASAPQTQPMDDDDGDGEY